MIRILWLLGVALIAVALGLAARGLESTSFWLIVVATGLIAIAFACEARQ